MLLNCGVGEDSWESLGLQGDQTNQLQRKLVLNIDWKDWCWKSLLWPPDAKNWLIGKDPDAGKDWRQKEKGMTEDEILGWHHWLNGHESEQALGVHGGQGSLVHWSPWVYKESDMTEQWIYIFIASWNDLSHTNLYAAFQGSRFLVQTGYTQLKEAKRYQAPGVIAFLWFQWLLLDCIKFCLQGWGEGFPLFPASYLLDTC